MFKTLATVALALAVLTLPAWAGGKTVGKDSVVKVHYTLRVDGQVVDSSEGRKPFQFQMGRNQVIKGFERALLGMKEGQRKSFRVSPEEGYGPRDPGKVQEIPLKDLPEGVKAGDTLYAQMQSGRTLAVKVLEVKKDVALIDFNHPMAGKTLEFEVQVLEVK
jgi:FKBP-type peptidyl-prolyl cis-trans isomerase 2